MSAHGTEVTAGATEPESVAGRADRSPRAVSRAARKLVIFPIRVYQKLISPALGPRCKYYPSCSEYAAQAVTEYGILRGLVLGGWRLLRCNPWSRGGFDPVEEQRLFKPHTPAHST